jgi:CheY-like chemotaxis protein
VTEAVSAEAALALVQGGMTPDVLLTDHLMPGMSGSELARALRATHPGLPVLILSGYAASEGLAPDLPRLTKPFRKDDLAAALAELDGPSAAWAMGRA